MQIGDEENRLELLHLKIKYLNANLSVNAYSKPRNKFIYVIPSAFYPVKKIIKVPKEKASKIWWICNTTKK